jgi:hypothetical protein
MDINAALAALARTDVPIPQEPGVRHFVRDSLDGRALWAGHSAPPTIPWETFRRHCGARRRLLKRLNQLHCDSVRVPCRACGEMFRRDDIRRVRCDDCVARARAANAPRVED